jgi:hypothetical protein
MKYDVELPQEMIQRLRRALKIVLILGAIVGLVFLGKSVSPVDARGNPVFLSPRLAQISTYQRDVRRWAANLKEIQAGLGELLSNPTDDILNMDRRANLLYGHLVSLQAEVDGTSVPPTLEALHASMGDAVNTSLDAALQVAAWISEPTTDNFQSAESGLSTAEELLDGIYQNPWVQEKP